MPVTEQDSHARLILALVALLAYAGMAAFFAWRPPALPGDAAGSILTTLQNLVVLAFTYYFHSQVVGPRPPQDRGSTGL